MGANAQTSVPTFTSGQVLTAAQMNDSARTGVPVFADATARDAGFGGTGEKVLAEGQLAYLEDLNVVQYYDGSNWATVGPSTATPRLGQVVSTNKTDSFSTSSTTFVDVTGVSVSITPTVNTSKVLVIFQSVVGNTAGGSNSVARLNLLRDSTNIAQSTGTNIQTLGVNTGSNNAGAPSSIVFLDSPATTSAITYKIQACTISGGGSIAIGRDVATSNYNSHTTITVIEVLV
jgi:hypothetical protein